MISTIVVVRFSLRIADSWQRKVYGGEANRTQWLSDRLILFERTLLRSLYYQSVRPRKVYLLCDKGDQQFLNERVAHDCCTLIYCSGSNYIGQMGADLERCKVTTNLAICRLDSDDLVAKDYVAAIEQIANANANDRLWLVAVNGFRTDFRTIQRVYYRGSPFLTLFLRSFHGEDVYGMNHELVVNMPNTRVNDPRTEWIQVIHGGNVGNILRPDEMLQEAFEKEILTNPKFAAERRSAFDLDWFERWSGFDRPAALDLVRCPVLRRRS